MWRIPPIKSMSPTFSALLSYTFSSRKALIELHPSAQSMRTLRPAEGEPKEPFHWEKWAQRCNHPGHSEMKMSLPHWQKRDCWWVPLHKLLEKILWATRCTRTLL